MEKNKDTESQGTDIVEEVADADGINDISKLDDVVEMIDAEEIERMLRKRKSFHRRVIAALMIILMVATYTVFRGSWW